MTSHLLMVSLAVTKNDNNYTSFVLGVFDELESCIIMPPTDITIIPQQYIVKMNTSEVPPSRLTSFIPCTDGDGITCEQSYYTLIDLNEERYQFSLPITWSTNDVNNIEHNYTCRVKFGGSSIGAGSFNTIQDTSISIKGKCLILLLL